MANVVITVQGRASARIPAERATARLAVQADGAERDEVMAAVTRSAASVRDLLMDAGDSVDSWSSNTARAWSERPWNQDGGQLEPVLHARVDIVAVLTDADALAQLLDDAVLLDGVEIEGIDWSLTDQSRQHALADVRRSAVADASVKATAYARAVGLDNVRPLAIADAGMLDGSGTPGGQPVSVMRAATVSDSAGLTFTPQPIDVEALVDVRYIAS